MNSKFLSIISAAGISLSISAQANLPNEVSEGDVINRGCSSFSIVDLDIANSLSKELTDHNGVCANGTCA